METGDWVREVFKEVDVVKEERFEVEEANEVWDLPRERVSFEVEDSENEKRKLRKKVSNEVRGENN